MLYINSDIKLFKTYNSKEYFWTYPAAQGTETIATLNTSTINIGDNLLSIGTNGTANSTIVIGSDTNAQTTIKSTSIGILANTTVSGNLTTTLATTSNSYNLLGTPPTITKSSLGYYVNYVKVSNTFQTCQSLCMHQHQIPQHLRVII